MKILAITQARIGSTRLSNKVLRKIGEETLLSLHLKRILKSSLATKVIVATTYEEGADEIVRICNDLNVEFFQGSLEDVLDRFYQAAKDYHPDWVVRVTSDCPLLDPRLIDQVIGTSIESDVDYCSNIITEDYPDGQDVEVFKFSALERAWKFAHLKSEREHVTPYIIKNSDLKSGNLFKAFDVKCATNFNSIRMTIDEKEDLDVIRKIISDLGCDCSWKEYTNYLLKHKNTLGNTKIKRNEGYRKSLKND